MYVNKKDIDLSHITNDESLTCPKLPLPILTPYFDCLRWDTHINLVQKSFPPKN